MYMIEAVVRPNKVDAIRSALAKLDVLGLTAVECKGYGRQMGHTERYRGYHDEAYLPKVLLKVGVKESVKDAVVQALIQVGRTGEVGDGKIFVHPVSEIIRIRTGDTGESAL